MKHLTSSHPPVTARPAPSFLPSVCVFELTGRCNCSCLYCSCPWEAPGSSLDPQPEMTPDEWNAAITRLAGMGVTSMAFTGGEALLKEGLTDIIAHAASVEAEHIEPANGELHSRWARPHLFLLSNGLLMSHKILDLCEAHEVGLSMSLPGLNTYREHTRAGSPDSVLHWFGEAQKRGIATTVNVTVTRRNLPELYETLGEALLAGADKVLLNRFLPGGRGLLYVAELTLSADEIVEMLDVAEDVLRTANRVGSVGTELPLCVIQPDRYVHLRVGTQCSAARGFFVVGPAGRVRVCNHSPIELAHVADIESVKDDPYWRRFALADYLPPQCGGCDLRSRCDGGCREAAHIVGGKVDSPDPVLACRGI